MINGHLLLNSKGLLFYLYKLRDPERQDQVDLITVAVRPPIEHLGIL